LFGRAAIALGIGPHSSSDYNIVLLVTSATFGQGFCFDRHLSVCLSISGQLKKLCALNFRGNMERVLVIMNITNLPFGRQYVMIQDATKFPMMPLLLVTFAM